MKKNIFSICSLLSICASALLLTGCADEFDNGYPAGEKPAEVVQAEQLAQYSTLTSYCDAANFRLGNTLTSAVFDEMGVAASMTLSNFNELSLPDLFVHKNLVDDAGVINILSASSVAKTASEHNIAVFAPALASSTNLNTTNMEELIQPEIVEEEAKTGNDVIDFENYELATTFPMLKATGEAGKGTATIEDDGDHAHVVHVKSGTVQSYPAIEIEFPEGRTLADYRTLTIDYKAKKNSGITNKVFFAMGGKNVELKTFKDYGCTLNNWGKVTIDLDDMSYSDTQKAQKKVTLMVGPKTMSCDYEIDNVTLHYSYIPTYEVEKTPEEKHQIIAGELNKFITETMTKCATIPSWTVADNPISSSNFWKQYMGETYFIEAAAMMRKEASAAKLFISENVTDATVRTQLITLLNANQNQIDGFDVPLTIDAATFDATAFGTVLSDLAATGKLVRLNIQAFTGATDADAGNALIQAVKTYKAKVPAAQRYGISFAAVNESSTNAGLWTQGYNRKLSYGALADELKAN